MRLSEAFERYREDVIFFRNQSSKTEETHQIAKRQLVAFLGDKELESLRFDDVRRWKAHLEKGREAATVREYIIRLRVVLRHLQKRGIPCLDYELIGVPKRLVKVPEFLTTDQVRELITAVARPRRGYPAVNRLRNAAILSLLYASGIRASELCQLDRSDLRDDGTFTVIGKGRKPRLCFYDERSRHYMDEYLDLRHDANPALFISDQNGRRISKSTLQVIFLNARKRVNFKTQVHAHTMRHSFATDLLRNNTNMRYVQEMLGHSSIQTTQMYTHVVNSDLKQVYAEHHTV